MSPSYKTVLQKVKKHIAVHRLLSVGDRVLVALSGGSDSIFLLHILHQLKDQFDLSIAAAHLNHQLRKEAAEEAQFVEALCKSLGIQCFVRQSDIEFIARQKRISCETAGRDERYSFFYSLKEEYGFSKIATAHHLNDNAETILIHFLRGSGQNGLRGIDPIRPDGIIRPLLGITKEEILNCCQENSWEYVSDNSNFEPIYTRNQVRLALLPEILTYNPNFVKVVTDNAQLFAEDEDFINVYTTRVFMENYNDGSISKAIIEQQPPAIGRRLIQQLYKKSTGQEQNLPVNYIQSVLRLNRNGQSVSLPHQMTAELTGGRYRILPPREVLADFEFEIVPQKPLYLPHIGEYWLIKPAIRGEKDTFFLPDNTTLTVRNRRRGDTFCPMGMNGTKTISNFFTDKKIPPEQRSCIPLLTAGKQIINIGGVHRDRRFYTTNEKNSPYRLEIYKKT